jgi:hypothetical protein
MPLTSQPFAHVPEIDQLHQQLRKNVPENERVFGGVLGFTAIAAGLGRSGLSRWALLLAGAALIRRSVTGYCGIYDRLHVPVPSLDSTTPGH